MFTIVEDAIVYDSYAFNGFPFCQVRYIGKSFDDGMACIDKLLNTQYRDWEIVQNRLQEAGEILIQNGNYKGVIQIYVYS